MTKEQAIDYLGLLDGKRYPTENDRDVAAIEFAEDRGRFGPVSLCRDLLLLDRFGGIDPLVHERLETFEILKRAGVVGEIHALTLVVGSRP